MLFLFRNIQIDDAEHKVSAFGDYGEYWKEYRAMLCSRSNLAWWATIRVKAIRLLCVPIRCFFIRSRRASRALCRFSSAKVKKAAALTARIPGRSCEGEFVCEIHWLRNRVLRVQKPRRMDRRPNPLFPSCAGAVKTSSETADAGSKFRCRPIAAVARLKKEETRSNFSGCRPSNRYTCFRQP